MPDLAYQPSPWETPEGLDVAAAAASANAPPRSDIGVTPGFEGIVLRDDAPGVRPEGRGENPAERAEGTYSANPADPIANDPTARAYQQKAVAAQRNLVETEQAVAKEESAQLKRQREAAEGFLHEEAGFKLPHWDAAAERAATATPAWMAFFNPAFAFSILAAGKTRMAMSNAMAGAAGALNAIKENDENQYKQNFEAFKLNTDLAIKQQGILHQNYQDAMELYRTTPVVAAQKFREAAILANDQVALGTYETFGPKETADLMAQRVKLAETLKERAIDVGIQHEAGLDLNKPLDAPENALALKKYRELRTIENTAAGLPRMEYEAYQELKDKVGAAEALRQVREGVGHQTLADRLYNQWHSEFVAENGREPTYNESLDAKRQSELKGKEAVNDGIINRWREQFRAETGRDPTPEEEISERQMLNMRTGSPMRIAVDAQAKKYMTEGDEKGNKLSREEAYMRASADYAGRTAEARIKATAETRANSAALSEQVRRRHAINSFISLGDKNGDILDKLTDKVGVGGIPVFNRWVLAGRKSVAGDPDVATYDAQVKIFQAEAARILTASPGSLSGQLTDHARAEFDAVLSGNFTATQMHDVIKLLRQDFRRRIDSIDEEIAIIKGQLSIKALPGDQRTEAGTPSPPTAPDTGGIPPGWSVQVQ